MIDIHAASEVDSQGYRGIGVNIHPGQGPMEPWVQVLAAIFRERAENSTRLVTGLFEAWKVRMSPIREFRHEHLYLPRR